MNRSDRIALVTGASRGIGAAIADRLCRDGIFTVGTATTRKGAEEIARNLGDGGAGRVLDVTDGTAIDALVNDLHSSFGAPLILVNNAGITRDGLLLRMSWDQWAAVLDTDLNAIYRVCKAFLLGMVKARWGRIVNVGSVIARLGNAGQTNYAAAKSGVEGLTRSLAHEVGGRNITVNTLAPGFIETDMTKNLSTEVRARLLASIPVKRLGTPEDVAAVAAFLCSPEAAYVTGQTIAVDGGMRMI